MNKPCPHCDSPLVAIDLYGEHLLGCIHCNLWGLNDNSFFKELNAEDIAALRETLRPH
jgi:hypothetical protein